MCLNLSGNHKQFEITDLQSFDGTRQFLSIRNHTQEFQNSTSFPMHLGACPENVSYNNDKNM